MKVKYGINYVQLSMTMCVKIIKTAKRENEECEGKGRKQTQIYFKWEKNTDCFPHSVLGLGSFVFGFGLVKSLTFFMNVITFVGNILSAFVCVCVCL